MGGAARDVEPAFIKTFEPRRRVATFAKDAQTVDDGYWARRAQETFETS